MMSVARSTNSLICRPATSSSDDDETRGETRGEPRGVISRYRLANHESCGSSSNLIKAISKLTEPPLPPIRECVICTDSPEGKPCITTSTFPRISVMPFLLECTSIFKTRSWVFTGNCISPVDHLGSGVARTGSVFLSMQPTFTEAYNETSRTLSFIFNCRAAIPSFDSVVPLTGRSCAPKTRILITPISSNGVAAVRVRFMLGLPTALVTGGSGRGSGANAASMSASDAIL
mmetsp:Transcript_41220/g.109074  ORF Transcript_41220/g.109074 Transcript_41220/m.109074 type:complete len:232 (+) Transcript_41220:697-1392(+)